MARSPCPTPFDSIAADARGDDITFNIELKSFDFGMDLLEEAFGAGMDIAAERVRGGSVAEVRILSGGENITSWDGGAIFLDLPAGSGDFEKGKGYRVIQISAGKSESEHTGRCWIGGEDVYVGISITHLSAFVVLSGAVEEGMGAEFIAVVESPLAAVPDGGSGAGGSGMSRTWAAAGLALAAIAVGAFALKRRQRS